MVNSRLPAFTERFIKLRGEMTQAQFADLLGLSRPTVSLYESGKRVPGAEELKTIAKKCNVSADYLLGLREDPTTDRDLQFMAEYTGLSSDTLKMLHKYAHLRGHESGILETFDTFIQLFYNRFALRLLNIKTAVRDSKDCLDNNSKEEIRWYNICYEDLREKLFSFSELCRAIPNELFDSEKIYKALDEKAWPASQVKETDIEEFLLSGDY